MINPPFTEHCISDHCGGRAKPFGRHVGRGAAADASHGYRGNVCGLFDVRQAVAAPAGAGAGAHPEPATARQRVELCRKAQVKGSVLCRFRSARVALVGARLPIGTWMASSWPALSGAKTAVHCCASADSTTQHHSAPLSTTQHHSCTGSMSCSLCLTRDIILWAWSSSCEFAHPAACTCNSPRRLALAHRLISALTHPLSNF